MAFVDYIQTTSVPGRQQFGHTESDDQRADVAGQYYKQQQQKTHTTTADCQLVLLLLFFFLFIFIILIIFVIMNNECHSKITVQLLTERFVGQRERSGVERPCAVLFTLLGL